VNESDVDPNSLVVFSGTAGRMRTPAEGLLGGSPGSKAEIEVAAKPLAATASPDVRLRAGQKVRLLLPGGGGYGDPTKRDPEAIKRDLRNGYISTDGARRDYGWTA
jgi:N-methylhydantoinase B